MEPTRFTKGGFTGDLHVGGNLTVDGTYPSGGGGGGGILMVTDTSGTLNKTWQEIHESAFAVINSTPTPESPEESDLERREMVTGTEVLTQASKGDGEVLSKYYVFTTGEVGMYSTSSADGYPVVDNS